MEDNDFEPVMAYADVMESSKYPEINGINEVKSSISIVYLQRQSKITEINV